MTKPSWYDYRYCEFCGKELNRIEQPSTQSFNPRTGKARTFISYQCPEWGTKTPWGSHFSMSGVFDLEPLSFPAVYEDTREEPV